MVDSLYGQFQVGTILTVILRCDCICFVQREGPGEFCDMSGDMQQHKFLKRHRICANS